MKIVKPGQLKSERVYTGTCTNCGCVVEFKEGEAEYRSYPRNESALVVKCPTPKCHKEIFVSA
jgi:Rieske Fe-S protein